MGVHLNPLKALTTNFDPGAPATKACITKEYLSLEGDVIATSKDLLDKLEQLSEYFWQGRQSSPVNHPDNKTLEILQEIADSISKSISEIRMAA